VLDANPAEELLVDLTQNLHRHHRELVGGSAVSRAAL
jgi:hypothetical protein